jgi:hypothetical protein
MPDLVLLGDSVIDNGAYVGPDEPDVAAQLRERLPDSTVHMRAVDGYRTADVLSSLDGLPEGARVFLSTGGNDALGHMELLANPLPMPLAAALSQMREIREDFRSAYTRLLDGLIRRPVMVATIYNPSFTGDQAALQAPGEGGLSVFNDVILSEALARGFAILDLRRLFTHAADYANPIEPSAIGGAKIADAVASWCR